MHEHHLQLNVVPPGHPGATREVGRRLHRTENPFRRAAAEAALLRTRLCEHEKRGDCDGALAQEAA